jgi:transposase
MRQPGPALRRRGLPAEVAGMAEIGVPASPANGTSYEVRKRFRRDESPTALEVRVRAERRRRWSAEDKLRIVRETLEPGAVAKAVAERHGISTGLLFTWRREMLAAAMSGFVPVEVAPEVPQVAAPARETTPEMSGGIEVTFPSGATVRISGRVDMAMVRSVLAELGGR